MKPRDSNNIRFVWIFACSLGGGIRRQWGGRKGAHQHSVAMHSAMIAMIKNLQFDLNTLTTWCNTWLLRFNTDKCKVMQFGCQSNNTYFMHDGADSKELVSTNTERDLGVYVQDDLK